MTRYAFITEMLRKIKVAIPKVIFSRDYDTSLFEFFAMGLIIGSILKGHYLIAFTLFLLAPLINSLSIKFFGVDK